ncbi:Uu.00g039810.m01.CDS01 [Anthostomella pinea]|uniref:Uu.00g039810.m01.CDS01 n=1 Tax=Anthostomella pinea TaxID=933095 RepID=A0AAI8V546_9PEZI|nr:Uu.00g039810.m01.CDS01 [Anthostomella pinea]
MAASHDEPPTFHRDSPSPETTPGPALGSKVGMGMPRCLSTASSVSRGSSTDGSYRDSFGSESYSRHSSSSYQSRRSDISFASSRQSTMSFDRPAKRRGYTRPQGTDFAASAKQRESVLSLGSISHLQYYFARTGLLDGKGGQLSRKRHPRATLDLSSLDASSYLNPNAAGSDVDSSYASMGSSPDLGAPNFGGGPMVESPTDDHEGGFDFDDFEGTDPDILPPTTSTYNHRVKPVARPPTIEELKADLTQALDAASKVLAEAAPSSGDPPSKETTTTGSSPSRSPKPTQGWYEIQGMQVLDVMTLAIRAAKVYYTAHDHPDRLDAIKSEREIRSDLLSVMEVLKHTATRNFAGGTRVDEHDVMTSWIEGIHTLLRKEDEMENTERRERASWTWLKGDWTGREIEREIAFLSSLDSEAEPLPPWTPIEQAAELPTPFLRSMQNGLRLVQFHNEAVKKSRRRFGSIGTFHTDTQKPYRCADNLRYWIKAGELRWEVMLKVDVMGIVSNSNPEVWKGFEAAIWQWCRKVREEITAEWES